MYCEIISFRVHTTLYFFFQKWHIQGHCNVWISTHLHDELNLKLFFTYIWMCSSMIKLIKINGNECTQHIILIPQLISLCVKTLFFLYISDSLAIDELQISRLLTNIIWPWHLLIRTTIHFTVSWNSCGIYHCVER